MAFKGDLPNQCESQNHGGEGMLVRSLKGDRQASLAGYIG